MRGRLGKRTQRRRKPPKDLPPVVSRDRALATNEAVIPPLVMVPAGTLRTLSSVVHSDSFLDKVTIPPMMVTPKLKSEGVPSDSLDIEELFMSKRSFLDVNPECDQQKGDVKEDSGDMSDDSQPCSPKLLPSETLMSLDKRSSDTLARRNHLASSLSEKSVSWDAGKIRARSGKIRTVTAPEIGFHPSQVGMPTLPKSGSKSTDLIPVGGIKRIEPTLSLSIDAAGFDAVCSASDSSLKSMTPVPTKFGHRRPDEPRLTGVVGHSASPRRSTAAMMMSDDHSPGIDSATAVVGFPSHSRQRSNVETRKSLPPLCPPISSKRHRDSDRVLSPSVSESSSSPGKRESLELQYAHYQPHRPRRKKFAPLSLTGLSSEPAMSHSRGSIKKITPESRAIDGGRAHTAVETPDGDDGDEYRDQHALLTLLKHNHAQMMRLQREALPHVLSDCVLTEPWKAIRDFRVMRLGGMVHIFGHVTGGVSLSQVLSILPQAARPSVSAVKFACMVESIAMDMGSDAGVSSGIEWCQISVNNDGRMTVSRCPCDLSVSVIILDGLYFPVF